MRSQTFEIPPQEVFWFYLIFLIFFLQSYLTLFNFSQTFEILPKEVISVFFSICSHSLWILRYAHSHFCLNNSAMLTFNILSCKMPIVFISHFICRFWPRTAWPCLWMPSCTIRWHFYLFSCPCPGSFVPLVLDTNSDFWDLRPLRYLIRVMSRQKDEQRVPYCDVRAVPHFCDVVFYLPYVEKSNQVPRLRMHRKVTDLNKIWEKIELWRRR